MKSKAARYTVDAVRYTQTKQMWRPFRNWLYSTVNWYSPQRTEWPQSLSLKSEIQLVRSRRRRKIEISVGRSGLLEIRRPSKWSDTLPVPHILLIMNTQLLDHFPPIRELLRSLTRTPLYPNVLAEYSSSRVSVASTSISTLVTQIYFQIVRHFPTASDFSLTAPASLCGDRWSRTQLL